MATSSVSAKGAFDNTAQQFSSDHDQSPLSQVSPVKNGQVKLDSTKLADARQNNKPTINLEELIDRWPENVNEEPASMTRLNDGESFFTGVSRVADRIGEADCVQSPSKGPSKYVPGMDVKQGQVGIITDKGSIQYRKPGHYATTGVKPWKKEIGVVNIRYDDGKEFNPIRSALNQNPNLGRENLSDHFRQVVVANHQLAVFQTQGIGTHVRRGPATYVYGPATELRGTVDRNNLANKVNVKRQTEDTTSASRSTQIETNQYGQRVATQRAHGTDIQVQDKDLLAGSYEEVGGVTFASPASGFNWIVQNKSFADGFFTGNGLMIGRDGTTFPKNAEGQIKFADLGQYSRSTPLMEFKSKNNYNVICRAMLTWTQTQPELWERNSGAYSDPFDALEEPLKQALRDWLNSVDHKDALDAKSQKFSNVEDQLLSDLNKQASRLGISIKDLQISDLRFPDLDVENEKLAAVKAASRQDIQTIQSKAETEKAKLESNLRGKQAELETFQKQNAIEQERVNAEEIRNKRELDLLNLKQTREKSELAAKQQLELARVAGENEISQKLAEGMLQKAELEAKTSMAMEKAKLKALTEVFGNDRELLMEVLSLQSRERNMAQLADAAKVNNNVSLNLDKGDEQEVRRMNKGFAPQAAVVAPVVTETKTSKS
ncbi:MAG: SPFH domain-containing protein [Pseudomonadota bacterium]|nr:SPFH domain-containing protein [Pseudomonadota bacterium]